MHEGETHEIEDLGEEYVKSWIKQCESQGKKWKIVPKGKKKPVDDWDYDRIMTKAKEYDELAGVPTSNESKEERKFEELEDKIDRLHDRIDNLTQWFWAIVIGFILIATGVSGKLIDAILSIFR